MEWLVGVKINLTQGDFLLPYHNTYLSFSSILNWVLILAFMCAGSGLSSMWKLNPTIIFIQYKTSIAIPTLWQTNRSNVPNRFALLSFFTQAFLIQLWDHLILFFFWMLVMAAASKASDTNPVANLIDAVIVMNSTATLIKSSGPGPSPGASQRSNSQQPPDFKTAAWKWAEASPTTGEKDSLTPSSVQVNTAGSNHRWCRWDFI